MNTCATCPLSLVCLVAEESNPADVKLIGGHAVAFFRCSMCKKNFVRRCTYSKTGKFSHKETTVLPHCPAIFGIGETKRVGTKRVPKSSVCNSCYALYDKTRRGGGRREGAVKGRSSNEK